MFDADDDYKTLAAPFFKNFDDAMAEFIVNNTSPSSDSLTMDQDPEEASQSD